MLNPELVNKIAVYAPSEPSGFRWVDQIVLDDNNKIPSAYLRGVAVYVQETEPTDMEVNDIWIKI